MDVLEEAVRSMMDTFQKYPDAEELSQCVTWDEMQSLLLGGREDPQQELVSSGVVDPVAAVTAVKAGPKKSSLKGNIPALNAAPSHSSTPSSPHPVDDTVRPAAPPAPSISGQISVDARTATEAPSVLSGPTGAPPVLSGPTGAPSVLSGPTGAPSPSVLSGPTGAPSPSVLSGPTGAPSVLSGPTEAPSVLSGPTEAPSVLSGPTGAPTTSVLSGPTGAPSPSVLSGPTGAPSPSVLSGPTGAPSPSVLTGPTGAPSPSVLSGPTGAPSPSVLTGPTGAPSPSVLSGPTGAPSPSVLTGPTGAPSPSVLSGPTGAPSPSVLSGPTGVPSPSVLTGPTGAPSPSVLTGPTGAPSPSVLSGPTGAPSPSVLTGPTGAPSPSVLSGPTGAPSSSVLSGPTGAPSPSVLSGPTGAPSPSVLSGPTGAPSPSVLSGPTGAPSPSVLSGPTGTPLPSVLSGPTGAPSPSVLSGPTGAPSVLSGPTGQTNTRLTAAGRPLTHKARSTEIYSETVEALRDIGKLKERFSKLEVCVEAVEEGKVDKSQLKQLITNKDSFDESNNLTDQLNQLKALVDNLMSDREKDKFMNLTSPDMKATSEAASGSKELRQPKSDLRITIQKLEEDVTQLKDKQALTVGRATDRDLQDQLDNLRGMLDDVMQSLTSQLTLNLSEAGQDESDDIQGLSQRKERSASRHSIVDTGRRFSILFQHYEELQDSVNSLLQQQTGATTGPLKDREAS
ncbi:uncharacterized protein LOC141780494 isoform X2 [Sebastes fasciatus]|uniref:uncharacterized protein LOC141780494 isoform X2 n=1 Tax=Sebastes fasciatus TaxID=394691 RepID=UPI003D9EFC1A